MKILILANFDVGLFKFRKELIQKLILQGHKVYISLPDGNLVRKLEAMGCVFIDTPVDRRGINPVRDIKLLIKYIFLVQKQRPDLVIAYTIKPNIYGGIVCRIFGIEYAVNITGLGTAFQKRGLIRTLVKILYKFALKGAKVVFFENSENAETMVEMGCVKQDKVCVLNGAGVNLDEYPYTEYPSEEEGTRFLFIGRVMKEKGVDELFTVAEKMKKEGKNVFFDIVGPLEDDYRERVDELVKRAVIEYHGYQEDVKPYIARCHCFVLPSYHEGMANTNLESAAMGRPIITTDIPGCREAVLDGRSGFVCKSKDSKDLLKKLTYFSMLQEHREMGIASRQLMEERFDKKKVVEKTINALLRD